MWERANFVKQNVSEVLKQLIRLITVQLAIFLSTCIPTWSQIVHAPQPRRVPWQVHKIPAWWSKCNSIDSWWTMQIITGLKNFFGMRRLIALRYQSKCIKTVYCRNIRGINETAQLFSSAVHLGPIIMARDSSCKRFYNKEQEPIYQFRGCQLFQGIHFGLAHFVSLQNVFAIIVVLSKATPQVHYNVFRLHRSICPQMWWGIQRMFVADKDLHSCWIKTTKPANKATAVNCI